jgi:hypothetical protein
MQEPFFEDGAKLTWRLFIFMIIAIENGPCFKGKKKVRMLALIFSAILFVTLLMTDERTAFPMDSQGKGMEMKSMLPLEVGGYKFDGKDQFYD